MKNTFVILSFLLLVTSFSVFAQDTTATDTRSSLAEVSNNRGRLREKIDSVQTILGEVQRDLGTVQGGLGTVKESVDSLVFNIDSTTKQIQDNTFFGTKEWIGWWVAILSLIVAAITFWAQSKTEKHTQNAPISAQIGQFKDLTRHLYRNLVCTSAAIARYNNKDNKLPNRADKDTKRESYPSESNFNKLKTMPEDVILNIDVDERTYSKLHELRVLLRNYNIEIDVACNHVSNGKIQSKLLEQDFDNLLFKPLHLVKETFKPESLLLSIESGNLTLPDRCLLIVLEEHFKKLKVKANINALGKKSSQDLLKGFIGQGQPATEARPLSEQCALYFKKHIDVLDSVNRALDNLCQLAIDSYGSLYIEKREDNGYRISIPKKDFFAYLDNIITNESNDVAHAITVIKRRIRLMKVLSIIWPFKSAQRKNEIKLLESSVKIFNKQLDNLKNGKKLSSFIESLSKVSNQEEFENLNLVDYNEDESGYVSYAELYNSLKPYISYIYQFMYIMLAIDVSIEINRIGMVNYE